MTRDEANYIAGFFDGEGCIHFNKKTSKIQISITQKRPEVLFRIQTCLGYGKVGKQTKRGMYSLNIRRVEEVRKFLTKVGPYKLPSEVILSFSEELTRLKHV